MSTADDTKGAVMTGLRQPSSKPSLSQVPLRDHEALLRTLVAYPPNANLVRQALRSYQDGDVQQATAALEKLQAPAGTETPYEGPAGGLGKIIFHAVRDATIFEALKKIWESLNEDPGPTQTGGEHGAGGEPNNQQGGGGSSDPGSDSPSSPVGANDPPTGAGETGDGEETASSPGAGGDEYGPDQSAGVKYKVGTNADGETDTSPKPTHTPNDGQGGIPVGEKPK